MKFEVFKNYVPGIVEVTLKNGIILKGLITSHSFDKETMTVIAFNVMTETETIGVKSDDVKEITKSN
ncbi:MAG: hypothetical protein K2X86_07215 [Cytophagaceae bacterium]|nr:hypothetical protein [Cytophagaceae bacterium]